MQQIRPRGGESECRGQRQKRPDSAAAIRKHEGDQGSGKRSADQRQLDSDTPTRGLARLY
jgi:hypothetical protein